MTESQPEHQDPAEQYQVGTETETEPQADPVNSEQPDAGELKHGDDVVVSGNEATPVEVSPDAEQAAQPTQVIGGNDFTVDPERGHRRV